MEKSLLVWQKQIKGELKEQIGESGSKKNEPIDIKSKNMENVIDSPTKSQRSLFEFVQPAEENRFSAIFTKNFTEIDLKIFLMQWKIKNGFVLP